MTPYFPDPAGRQRTLRAALGAALLVVAAAPALASGCGSDMACVAWDASKGPCPDRQAALKAMSVPCSQNQVLTVQSDGELIDGDACCYEVTQIDNGQVECAITTGGTGLPSGSTVASSGAGASGSCSGLIGGACGACVEPACCTELMNCVTSQACVDCFNDGTTCANGVTTAQQADVLVGCMAAAQCPGDPCGVAAPVPPLCTAAVESPSGGKCVILGGQVLCNPITNEGCNAANGEVCDHLSSGGFQCVAHPQNAICNGCGATGWCAPGLTCFGSLCAKLCCNDADCGPGVCSKDVPGATPQIGICVQGTPGTGGMGAGGGFGSGGAGGA